MTDEQINAAIAEACGWKYYGHPDCISKKRAKGLMAEIWILRPDGELVLANDIPNYCNDLNAMHEAEKTLSETNMFVMAHHIERLVSRHGQHYFHATARQRAEAFLRTIGRWEE